jgi:sigma-B regulation protein RsbU (phosphoserine phosphatase)
MQLPGTTLLVIDDDAPVRERVVTSLEESGFNVLQAGLAADGLALLDRQRPDLVLCDLQIPSLYLSGDFVDYFRVSDTQLGFYLADVSGHGASSAFVTVLLKFMTTRLMYEQRKQDTPGPVAFKPSDVLGHINRSLIACKLGKHVTMLGGVIDEATHTLTYSIGGHLPLPVLYTDGQAHYLQGKGRPVGLFEDASYEDHEIQLPQRFSLTLCSDGVLDCLEGTTLREKEQRLPTRIAEVGGDLRCFMERLGLDASKPMPDDISVLVLSRNPA